MIIPITLLMGVIIWTSFVDGKNRSNERLVGAAIVTLGIVCILFSGKLPL
jgi:drug/metabolite transporter superfamily protein YnfA